MKNLKKFAFVLLIMFIGAFSLLFMPNIKIDIFSNADSLSTVINNKNDFRNALLAQKSSIIIDDIDFEGETFQINYSVTISSKGESATIQNVYFVINGSETNEFLPSITFKNIVFDGCVNAEDYNLASNQSYETIFGNEREDKRCINGVHGYYNLKLDNCTIKNYSSIIAPCVYIENTEKFGVYWHDYEKKIEIVNSKFFNNISFYDTLHLSNDKNNLKITNCEFYNNYAYKAAGFSVANGRAIIDGIKVYDNYFCAFDKLPNDFQSCGGGVYCGATDLVLKNSVITNNETIFGGGLAVVPAWAGDKQILIENVAIKNNKAVYGGGVCIHSLSGQPINFVNCDISNNQATTGSALYTDVYSFWLADCNGGLVNLFFCSMLLNAAEDTNTFGFYNQEQTRGTLGEIVVKGCFIVGNDTLEVEDGDYNYIATPETALTDGVVPENLDEIIETERVYPFKS